MDSTEPSFNAFTPDSDKGSGKDSDKGSGKGSDKGSSKGSGKGSSKDSRSTGIPGNTLRTTRQGAKPKVTEESAEQVVQRAEHWLAASDWARAWEESENAVRLATANPIRSREDQCLQARCYDALGQALFGLGYWEDGQKALERAAGAWETLERGPELARVLQNLAQLHKSNGKMDHALDLLRQAAHGWEREGCMAEAGLTWLELANCLADLGETGAAKRHLRQGLHRVDSTGKVDAKINARKLAASVCALLGDSEARMEQLEALCGLQEAWIRESKPRAGKESAPGHALDTSAVTSDASTQPENAGYDASYFEAIRTFTGKAAHDMKEPLRMIGSFSALLRRQYGTMLDAEGHEYLDIVLDANERMSELLNKLLDYTRLGASGKPAAEFDLADAALMAAHRLRKELDQRQALVETQAMPIITGQRGELELLVFHLLDNALKFNRSNRPHMLLSTEQEADTVILSVHDNGIGIAPASRIEVFDLFRRLQPRTEFRGSGIGLSMVARIAALHGGTCWIENSRLGGCAVRVRLPKKQPLT